MTSDYRPFRQRRAAGLQSGTLLDISPIARQNHFEAPFAITSGLWRLLAGRDAFRLEDPRLLALCREVRSTLLSNTAIRQKSLPYQHTLWINVLVGEREAEVKLVTHPGDDAQPVMTLLSAHEELVMAPGDQTTMTSEDPRKQSAQSVSAGHQPFNRSRAEALRSGALLDITLIANSACIAMPSAMSAKLWSFLAGGDPFHLKDPRVMSLCWCVFLFISSKAYDRQDVGPTGRTVWFEADIRGRKVKVKAMAHAGDAGEPVMTLRLAQDDGPSPAS